MSPPSPGQVVVALVGPTASGKSALSLKLAEDFDGEIVGCDALQVYRHLDVGTGKVHPGDRKNVPHHLIDVVDPDREFSAADYVRMAAAAIRDLRRRGKLAIVVGGTGMYLRSLRYGLFEGPGRMPDLRERISLMADRRGSRFIHQMLERLDPGSAARVHPNDGIRLVRALEVNLLSVGTMSDMMRKRQSPLPGYRFVVIGLAPPRGELVLRIERRVKHMFAMGLVDEVRRLREQFGSRSPAFKAIGYRQVGSYLDGGVSLSEAERQTVRATVQYAKRQMTWFRREEGIIWFAGMGDEPSVERRVRDHLRTEIESTGMSGSGCRSHIDLVSVGTGAERPNK